MSMIRTEHLAKSFGELVVLKDINLTVESGEVVVIIGPSGAGKSTFLRSLNNLEKITSGKIFIEDKLFYHRENDRTVDKMEAKQHKDLLLEMGMVFQRFNLFPHKTVLENVMLAPMHVKKVSRETYTKHSNFYCCSNYCLRNCQCECIKNKHDKSDKTICQQRGTDQCTCG